MDTKSIILKQVNESNLRPEEKNLWRVFVAASPDVLLTEMIDLLENDPESLSFLTKNMQDKIHALRTGEDNEWEKIIDTELKYIK